VPKDPKQFEFRGELRGLIAGPADAHTPQGTRAIKVQVGITFRADGARLQIESAAQIAEPETTALELPADVAAQLLDVLVNPRSSPVTSRDAPPYFDEDGE
jgi:hypothetical protein